MAKKIANTGSAGAVFSGIGEAGELGTADRCAVQVGRAGEHYIGGDTRSSTEPLDPRSKRDDGVIIDVYGCRRAHGRRAHARAKCR